ncbi:3-hydroxyacyl-[acyl-carrier-protein] dehydratase FabZ [Clostridium baratii]|uniref:3-hydroxyacyl-ACP dehydratase FabZ n=1 Tax=Clostridium baratii TaxID=1561 RepID=UPI0009A2D076|nr:3-hydroxyacyl-ACP dehydratase FabZ [Clostridium baratii]OPF51480.1 beta-hydroxyacyl-ACP dehydratase [Clostridium baratii]OPF55449.1 3-hydroxyacyl-[acyl-carrier-protein] dehydratase FabZ [Clostridium baratii]OPF57732.1 3-hydroxyacyl-[acyl-carrier-protein] dehydratase FabZ [Clostridium baratii]OPF60170.1 3-hydroxyacyl-[acyl-carrier-protein] dehydratase FabZ [Clostridium baratii]
MMGIKEIKEILPHRYPFLLVDRVIEMEEGKSITGYKNVTINEEFFNGHFPEEPVMPGVLILEAIAQVGAIAILSKEEFKGKIPLFAGADKVRFRQKVVPGDRLELSCEIVKLRGPVGIGKGIAKVDGKKVCEAEIMFAIG